MRPANAGRETSVKRQQTVRLLSGPKGGGRAPISSPPHGRHTAACIIPLRAARHLDRAGVVVPFIYGPVCQFKPVLGLHAHPYVDASYTPPHGVPFAEQPRCCASQEYVLQRMRCSLGTGAATRRRQRCFGHQYCGCI